MSAASLTPFETSGDALRHQAALRPAAEALAFPLSGGRRSFGAWLAESESLASAGAPPPAESSALDIMSRAASNAREAVGPAPQEPEITTRRERR